MLLADSAILQEINKGNILIRPFDPKCLGSNSYDVHLSARLKVYKAVTNVVETGDGDRVTGYRMYPSFIDARAVNPTSDLMIPEHGLILHPGVLYLGATAEYTNTQGLVPYLEGKSSMGRLGIKVHVTAGKGDIGFYGHWTLEIEVTHPVKVYPGMAVAQISYFRPEGFCLNPYNKKKDAKYNNFSEEPVASRNQLNFNRSANSYFPGTLEGDDNAQMRRWADSGIAGDPDRDAPATDENNLTQPGL